MIESNPEKILIVRFSSMGDVILASALFAALKSYYNDSEYPLLPIRSMPGFSKMIIDFTEFMGFPKKEVRLIPECYRKAGIW
jgi:ADP-heptose:LPS heptosyltransferase